MSIYNFFDNTFKVELGELLSGIWEAGRRILADIGEEVRGCGMDIKDPDPPLTNWEIEKLENHIQEYDRSADLSSFFSEYRKIRHLLVCAIAETLPVARSYADDLMHTDTTVAAGRLTQRVGFRKIHRLLENNWERYQHPKIAKTEEIIRENLVGQRVLVVCLQRGSIPVIGRSIGRYFNKVYSWDGKINPKRLTDQLDEFGQAYAVAAISTTTLKANKGLSVETTIVYDALSADWKIMADYLPPCRRKIVVAVNHNRLDLGRAHWRRYADTIRRSTAVTRRGRQPAPRASGNLF